MLNMNPCSHIAISILNKKNKRVLSRSAPRARAETRGLVGAPALIKEKKF